jgi:hypothetical protein
MPDGFHRISEIFDKEPGLSRIRQVIEQSDIVNNFGKIFPDLIKIAEAVKVESKCIFLRVPNSTWRSELKFREGQITKKINNYYKEERINQVRFIP